MKDSKTFWDKAAPRYAKSPIRDGRSYQKKLTITQSYFRPNWRVLEFGCGTGSTAIIHAPYVTHILATDISSEMLAIAKQKVRESGITNVSFQEGTLDSLELEPESFDAILGLNILHLLEDVEGTLVRTRELLKPGGIFVSSTALVAEIKLHWRLLIPLMQSLGFAPYVNRFTKSELTTLLNRLGFAIECEWQPTRESIFLVSKKMDQV